MAPRQVRVVDVEAEMRRSTLTLIGPRGVRIEGLTIAEVIAILRGLA